MQLELLFTGFEQTLLLNQQKVQLKIFAGNALPAEKGFNAVAITLDASSCSLLKWEEPLKLAREAVERGLLIVWELDFKLDTSPLEDEPTLMALQLNMRYFCESVWQLFASHSVGAILYKGEWHKEHLAYIKVLAALLSDEATAFILVDTTKLSLASFFSEVNQETLGHLIPILRGALPQRYPYAFPALGWDHGCSSLGFYSTELYEPLQPTLLAEALYLTEGLEELELENAIASLDRSPFRVIPENLLSQEWEGIDRLWLASNHLNEKARRQLCGFEAAGGQIQIL